MLIWCTLWTLDIGEIRRGLQLASCALSRGMDTPEGFKRSLIRDPERRSEQGHLTSSSGGLCERTHPTLEFDEGKDLQDKIRARLAKAYGLALFTQQPAQAEQLLSQAHALCSTIGVKGYLKKLHPVVSTNNN